tara:strand:- start:5992 stop:7428 length:1437 start_codon:yes stop_codon:yes gene_type:complete
MTPDITPLLQARQMKDQAFQNIAGTIAQFAAQKKQKTLEKQQKEQAISALTPIIESLKAQDPSLADFEAKDLVGSLGAKEALDQVQTLARTIATQKNAQNQLEAQQRQALAAEAKNQSDLATSKMQAALFTRFGDLGSMADQGEMQAFASVLMQESPEEYKFARVGEATKNAYDRGIADLKAKGERIDAKEAALKSEVDTTGRQIERRGMIFDAAQRAFGMLNNISEEEKKEFEELNSEFSSLFRSRDAQGNVSIKGEDFQNVVKQIEQRVKERFPGTKASTFAQAIQSLSGQIANATLQGTRADSRDGSSGYGQLTGPELTLLKNFYGALVTESGFMADFANVENTLRLIIEDMPRKSIAARDSMYESVLRNPALGITREDVDRRFKRSLGGKDPNTYKLFLFDAGDFFEGTPSSQNNNLPTPTSFSVNPLVPISPSLREFGSFPSSSTGMGTTSGGNRFEVTGTDSDGSPIINLGL